jgi:hypothetical protein
LVAVVVTGLVTSGVANDKRGAEGVVGDIVTDPTSRSIEVAGFTFKN